MAKMTLPSWLAKIERKHVVIFSVEVILLAALCHLPALAETRQSATMPAKLSLSEKRAAVSGVAGPNHPVFVKEDRP